MEISNHNESKLIMKKFSGKKEIQDIALVEDLPKFVQKNNEHINYVKIDKNNFAVVSMEIEINATPDKNWTQEGTMLWAYTASNIVFPVKFISTPQVFVSYIRNNTTSAFIYGINNISYTAIGGIDIARIGLANRLVGKLNVLVVGKI